MTTPDITTLFPFTTFPLHGTETSSQEQVGMALCAAEESGFVAPRWVHDLCEEDDHYVVDVFFRKVEGRWAVVGIQPGGIAARYEQVWTIEEVGA